MQSKVQALKIPTRPKDNWIMCTYAHWPAKGEPQKGNAQRSHLVTWKWPKHGLKIGSPFAVPLFPAGDVPLPSKAKGRSDAASAESRLFGSSCSMPSSSRCRPPCWEAICSRRGAAAATRSTASVRNVARYQLLRITFGKYGYGPGEPLV